MVWRLLLAAVVVAVAALGGATSARADAGDGAAVRVTGEAVEKPEGLVLAPWRYRPGDDPGWADPRFDDSAWEAVEISSYRATEPPASGVTGIGWFRVRIAADESMAGQPVALELWHRGASEVFLDGRLVTRFGDIEPRENGYNPRFVPVAVVFEGTGEHVLAVRYSNRVESDRDTLAGWWLERANGRLGFQARLRPLNSLVLEHRAQFLTGAGIVFGFSGLIAAFGVLHLLLFLYDPRERANLYFFVFTILIVLDLLVTYLGNWSGLGLGIDIMAGVTRNASQSFVLIAFLAFLYSAFTPRVPRFMLALVAWNTAMLGHTLLFPWQRSATRWVFYAFSAVCVGMVVYVIGKALYRRAEDSGIIAAGTLLLLLAPGSGLVRPFVTLPEVISRNVGLVAVLGLVISITGYLARRMVRANRSLEAKLVEVETLSARAIEQERREADSRLQREQDRVRMALLEAENARKAKELEEARQLQLSMLPSRVPELPLFDVAAYMRTATEVGGDYYDFYLSERGVLTVVVGDATGHGLRAGAVVTAAKGLFCELAEGDDIRATFGRMTRALKMMRLGRLYMALTIAKVEGDRMVVSAAGMPPILIFRASTGDVETITLKGMPLGAFANFTYEVAEVGLAVGDTVLLMSDGFPEMFNERREMLDYERAAEHFREAAGGSPADIVEHLRQAGESWAGERPPDDDVTFVVLKMRSPA